MKPYTKVYFKAFGLDLSDPGQFVECEVSSMKAVDIHHIIGRGKGGKDIIENLMAVTREVHNFFGDKPQHMNFLFDNHEEFLIKNNVEYDKEVLSELRKRYIEV